MKNKNRFLGQVALETPMWSDKKRPFFGLPLSFTRYSLYPDRITIDRGFIFCHHDELRLYRIRDLKMNRGPFQRLFGLGDVVLMTSDISTPRIVLRDILQPQDVFRTISCLAEEERQRIGVNVIESYPTDY